MGATRLSIMTLDTEFRLRCAVMLGDVMVSNVMPSDVMLSGYAE